MSQWLPISDVDSYKDKVGQDRLIIGYDPHFWGRNSGAVGECQWIGISCRWVLSRHPQSTFRPIMFQPLPDEPEAFVR